MPPTTAFICICQSRQTSRNAKSGLLLSTRWSRLCPAITARGLSDSPKILGETRRYIRDFERIAMQTTTARDLYDQMLKPYPDWGNPGALWTSAHAVKP